MNQKGNFIRVKQTYRLQEKRKTEGARIAAVADAAGQS